MQQNNNSPQPDVEALIDEIQSKGTKENWRDWGNADNGIRYAVEHIAATGLLNGVVPEKVEGLDEEISALKIISDYVYDTDPHEDRMVWGALEKLERNFAARSEPSITLSQLNATLEGMNRPMVEDHGFVSSSETSNRESRIHNATLDAAYEAAEKAVK